MKEHWRTIPGFPDYEVSDWGTVRSWMKRRPHVLKGSPRPSGHLNVSLVPREGVYKTLQIHQAVMLAFVGPRPEGLHTCHNDGNPANNRLGNLRYDTPSSNCLDTVKHGNNRFANQTHCINGHPFDEENTRYNERLRTRNCRTCKRDWMRADYARKKAQR